VSASGAGGAPGAGATGPVRVREADRAAMEAVLAQSHEIWGEGLSPAEYVRFSLEQKDTAWGRARYRFLVAEAGGTIVSALRLYSFPGAIDGRPIRLAGIGGVFTIKEHRGRGHARALIEAAIERAGALGHDTALLMSEIGPEYYERLGFEALPARAAGCLPYLPAPWAGEPAWVGGGDPESHVAGLRPYEPSDLDDLSAIHDEAGRGQRFRLLRDRPAWEQAVLKADLWYRLRGAGGDRVWVVERRGAVAAYVVLREVHGALQWREHGARLGHEDLAADLFWCALIHARRLGVNRMDAWQLPAVVTTRRLYPVAERPLREPAIMVRAITAAGVLPAFASPEECRVSWLDLF
jgi:predicted N-acetyltransferase YhbS